MSLGAEGQLGSPWAAHGGGQGSSAAQQIWQQPWLELSCRGAGRVPWQGCGSPMNLMAASRKGSCGLCRYGRLWCR